MRRVSGFARSVTRNWSRPAFFLKADVANFFNSIDRQTLVGVTQLPVPKEWMRSLLRQIALHDPCPGAVTRSPASLFARVRRLKSKHTKNNEQRRETECCEVKLGDKMPDGIIFAGTRIHSFGVSATGGSDQDAQKYTRADFGIRCRGRDPFR
jgi:hypothetical protein